MAEQQRGSVPRVVLEDRWAGLVTLPNGDWSKLFLRLDRVLLDVYAHIARVENSGESDPTSEWPDHDGARAVHELVLEAVKRTMLDEIERRGLAR